jgi:tether containing UBX domain for GLUT4
MLPCADSARYNKKQVDLSLTYRLSGLPSGAQLDLVQSSKSPAVVNVALQFPQSENNLRLTEKFPSSTSLWQILRRFESGVAGGTPYPLNITQRGIVERNTGAYGSGRMFYEMPTLSLMNREMSSFVDLQKTLAQIGVTSGSALLRLNFKHSGKPLEEAMLEISEYFKETEEASAASTAQGAHASSASLAESAAKSTLESATEPAAVAGSDNPPPLPKPESMEDVTPAPEVSASRKYWPSADSAATGGTSASVSQPRITAFLAPDGNPSAASITHNDHDYVPTIDHAKSHQARLEAAGRNTRLLSDAELEAQRKEKEAKLQAVAKVTVRFRMPDQTQIQTFYTREDTAQNLFATMADVLRYPTEPFSLSYRDATGKQVTVSPSSTQRLIHDLGWTGATLVLVSWSEGVSEQAKKEPALNDEYLKQATRLRVEHPKGEKEEEKEKKGSFLGGILGGGKEKGKSKLSAGEKEAKLGKLLGFNKKK